MDTLHVILWAVLVMIVLLNAPVQPTELFTPPVNYGAQAVKELKSAKVKAGKGSVERVAWSAVAIKPKKKTWGEAWGSVFNPTEYVRFTGRPKYVLKHNAIIAGKKVSFDAHGKSLAIATKAANAKAAVILKENEKALKDASLLETQ
jgi:hypothetical protein